MKPSYICRVNCTNFKAEEMSTSVHLDYYVKTKQLHEVKTSYLKNLSFLILWLIVTNRINCSKNFLNVFFKSYFIVEKKKHEKF